MDAPAHSPKPVKSVLAHWMRRVLKECASAEERLAPEPVHDLRVALRHCMFIAEGASEFDPYPGWKRLRSSAKQLLKHLGRLRDAQVLLEWLKRLELESSEAGELLKETLEPEEMRFRGEALAALASFNHKKWKAQARQLSSRASCIEPESLTAQYLALRRWEEAFDRHQFALRSRSKISFHRLRVAIKGFRYTLESFLPALYASWAADLKSFQDLLGERHDLDVLAEKISRFGSLDDATKADWKTRVAAELKQRLAQYLAKTKGKNSPWRVWRAALPHNEALEQAAVAALGFWSSFRTPNFARARHVAETAAELFEALAARGFADGLPTKRPRYVLEAAGLLQDVGRHYGSKGHHKRTYRMICRLSLPLGWGPTDLRLAALVARYHRKALPQLKHKEFRAVSLRIRRATLFLAGILRIANCFAQSSGSRVRKFSVDATNEGIVIQAYGFVPDEALLAKLASAKHLLEIACRRSILIIAGAAGAPQRAPAPAVSPAPAKVAVRRALRAHA